MKKNKPLELLAPAKDKKCAFAAINFGADAVYMGAPNYGARKNAANSIKDISEVARYAHIFNAKLYVTINTILTDDELRNVQKLLFELYEAGVDAIIVQDFGIFNLDIPPFCVFASTQCDIRNLQKVKFFEETGLSRVILARELSLEEIKNICDNTNIEVETFVHGALCVSYSGQCYLSSSIGGRSANRGECAQSCRRRYSLKTASGQTIVKDKYLLSLKDFCLIDNLDDLIRAGVTSFKIEGRLKDENYVKNVVAAYNLKLGKRKRASSGRVVYDFEPDVKKSFNRGFCTHFLFDGKRDIFNFDTPKSIGEYLGKISFIGKNYIEIKTKEKINPQDGLYCANGSGMLVNRVEEVNGGFRVYPNKMSDFRQGESVSRNFDCEFEKILTDSKTKRQIGTKITLRSDKVIAVDKDGNFAELEFSFDEYSNNPTKMLETFKTQFNKTGESLFYVEKFTVECDDIPYLKISKINELRRNLFEKLIQVRLKNYKRPVPKKIVPAPFPLEHNDYRLNIHNKSALDFYKKCKVNALQMSFESTKNKNAELMRTKHCIRRALNMCKKHTQDRQELYLEDENRNKFKLEFDCKNCEMIVKG